LLPKSIARDRITSAACKMYFLYIRASVRAIALLCDILRSLDKNALVAS
jgi:hypothetical protein